jgi:hypothetical protein
MTAHRDDFVAKRTAELGAIGFRSARHFPEHLGRASGNQC